MLLYKNYYDQSVFINFLDKIKILYSCLINISVNIHNLKYLGFDFS